MITPIEGLILAITYLFFMSIIGYIAGAEHEFNKYIEVNK